VTPSCWAVLGPCWAPAGLCYAVLGPGTGPTAPQQPMLDPTRCPGSRASSCWAVAAFKRAARPPERENTPRKLRRARPSCARPSCAGRAQLLAMSCWWPMAFSSMLLLQQAGVPAPGAGRVGHGGHGRHAPPRRALGASRVEDTGTEDTGAEDTGTEDTGTEDTGTEDTSIAKSARGGPASPKDAHHANPMTVRIDDSHHDHAKRRKGLIGRLLGPRAGPNSAAHPIAQIARTAFGTRRATERRRGCHRPRATDAPLRRLSEGPW
jgi:hypothetical protein